MGEAARGALHSMPRQARQAFDASGDPRLSNVQVERAAKAIYGTIVGSPLWVCFFALMCSEAISFLSAVPVLNALALVLIVAAANGVAILVLRAFQRSRTDRSEERRVGEEGRSRW